jgi:hypothetical protein
MVALPVNIFHQTQLFNFRFFDDKGGILLPAGYHFGGVIAVGNHLIGVVAGEQALIHAVVAPLNIIYLAGQYLFIMNNFERHPAAVLKVRVHRVPPNRQREITIFDARKIHVPHRPGIIYIIVHLHTRCRSRNLKHRYAYKTFSGYSSNCRRFILYVVLILLYKYL